MKYVLGQHIRWHPPGEDEPFIVRVVLVHEDEGLVDVIVVKPLAHAGQHITVPIEETQQIDADVFTWAQGVPISELQREYEKLSNCTPQFEKRRRSKKRRLGLEDLLDEEAFKALCEHLPEDKRAITALKLREDLRRLIEEAQKKE